MDKLIKVNLPRDKESYSSGNGEGIWVVVEETVKQAYDENKSDILTCGVLANDSCYYPSLKCGKKIEFELRGENRPVAIWDGFLSDIERASDEELSTLMEKILAHREQYKHHD